MQATAISTHHAKKSFLAAVDFLSRHFMIVLLLQFAVHQAYCCAITRTETSLPQRLAIACVKCGCASCDKHTVPAFLDIQILTDLASMLNFFHLESHDAAQLVDKLQMLLNAVHVINLVTE